MPVTALQICDLLNEAMRIDKKAMRDLCETRVPACQGFVDHPTIACYSEKPEDPPLIGVLGLINGIMGLAGKTLVAHYTPDNELNGFTMRVFNGDTPVPSKQGHDGPELREATSSPEGSRQE